MAAANERGLTAEQYRQLWDTSTGGGYPANHFAFRQILNVLHDRNAQNMVEVGIGHGGAIEVFEAAGIQTSGFDIDPEMVSKSQAAMTGWGLPEDRVTWGDIEDSVSLSRWRTRGQFDALLAMGVLPHVTHEAVALENMRHLVKPGGTVFVECRNKLFSLVTFNRYSYEFVMDDLLTDVSPEVRNAAGEFLRTRVDVDQPPKPVGHEAKYHNPLEVDQLFIHAGFTNVVIRPFHYHAAMPRLEGPLGEAFRRESIAMENQPDNWRGLFLCSAFIVQADCPRRPI